MSLKKYNELYIDLVEFQPDDEESGGEEQENIENNQYYDDVIEFSPTPEPTPVPSFELKEYNLNYFNIKVYNGTTLIATHYFNTFNFNNSNNNKYISYSGNPSINYTFYVINNILNVNEIVNIASYIGPYSYYKIILEYNNGYVNYLCYNDKVICPMFCFIGNSSRDKTYQINNFSLIGKFKINGNEYSRDITNE